MPPADWLDPTRFAFTWQAVPSLVAALVITTTAVLIVRWERGTRISWMLAGFCALFVAWAIGCALQRIALDPQDLVLISRYVYALVGVVVPLLYQVVCVVLHKEHQRLNVIVLSWAVGITLAILSTGSPWVVSGWIDYSWGMEPKLGPLGVAMLLGVGVLIGASAWDLYHVFRAAHPRSTDRRRTGLFGIGLLTLYLTPLDYVAGLGYPLYPTFGAASITVFTLITALVTWRYGLVEVTAQVVAREIIDVLRGALLVLDVDGAVQVANRACAQTIGMRSEELIGKSARSLFGEAFASRSLAMLGRMKGPHPDKEIVYTAPDGGTRHLAFSVVAARDVHDRDFAYICSLRDLTEQKRTEQQRSAEGLTDALTGLPNRAMFLSLLDSELRRAREARQPPPSVLFLGLDRLRVINEDLGYDVGDQVLAEVAARLRRTSTQNELIARLGGDEFGVLIDEGRRSEAVSDLASRIWEAIHEPLNCGEHTIYLSASIGVAQGTEQLRSASDLLGSAGIAMYRIKAAGGNGIDSVTAGELGSRRIRLEGELRRALEKREFRVFYQPVIDLDEGRVAAFEALVRWQHPSRGLLLPSEFIEFSEEIGLIAAIGRQVLEIACADLRRLRTALNDPRLSISVNLSEDELLKPDLIERTMALLNLHDLPASSLRFELLERTAMVGPVRSVLERLARLGLGLYLDDFGTGYSALSRLNSMPVTVLKIDREFVRAMSLGEGGEKLISGIVALALNMRLGVIAEGAGIAAEVRSLRELGCRDVQGFYFSEALPFDEAVAFARNRHALAHKIAAAELRRGATRRSL